MNARSIARRCVVQALYQWQMTQQPLTADDIDFILAKDKGRIDRAYFQELLDESVARSDEYFEHLAPYLDRRVAELDPVERAILLLGCCELASRHEVPFRVVINEAVEQAKMFGAQNGHRYINGILDKLAMKLRTVEVGAGGKKS